MSEPRGVPTDPGRAPQWQPVARSRAHELVISAIEDQILSGALQVGDPLPPERELAARLQVSRAGVREAIRVLEGQGALRSAVGAGRGAGTFIAAIPSEALTRFLRLHVALSSFPMADVVEARVMLERSSATLAASHASAKQLAAIEHQLLVMDEPGLDRADFNDADTQFHVAIAEAGGNRLVTDMTVAIRDSMRRPLLAAMQDKDDWDELAVRLRSQHHRIYQAIAGGDAQAAADLTEEHIRSAFAALPALRQG